MSTLGVGVCSVAISAGRRERELGGREHAPVRLPRACVRQRALDDLKTIRVV